MSNYKTDDNNDIFNQTFVIVNENSKYNNKENDGYKQLENELSTKKALFALHNKTIQQTKILMEINENLQKINLCNFPITKKKSQQSKSLHSTKKDKNK